MGTGTFALPAFRALLTSEHQIQAIVTQPDRRGRGHHRHPHPVRELGEQHNVRVLQPDKAADPEFLEVLEDLRPDLIVVAAYGQILKRRLLDTPRLGAFNLHGSLLPRHRGAAPVQYSIWKGDAKTGVTMFRIEPSLDSGPVVGVRETDILPTDTSESLMERLAELSVPLTLDVVRRLESGTAQFVPQDHSAATLAPKVQKSDGLVDWNQTPQQIDCHIRAMWPWPKASTVLHRSDGTDLRCILHEVQEVDTTPDGTESDVIGQIVTDQRQLLVRCRNGWVQILRIQPSGSRILTAVEFLNGQGDLADANFEAAE